MAEDRDRRKEIVNRNHMREMKNRIDLEYEAYLRHQEREREQAERTRQQQITSHYTHNPSSNIHSARSYKKPWQSGMTTKKTVTGPSAGERRQELQDNIKRSKLPPIHKNPEIIRKKASSTYLKEPQKPAPVVQPRIIVQQKRLHTRQLQVNPTTLVREPTRTKSAKLPIWEPQKFNPQRPKHADDGKLNRIKEQEKKIREQSVVISTHPTPVKQQRFIRGDYTKKKVLTPILTSIQDVPTTPLEEFERSWAIPRTSNFTDSPVMCFKECSDGLQERNFEEHTVNREETCEHHTSTEEGYVISEVPVSNSETDRRSEESETHRVSFEENENHENMSDQARSSCRTASPQSEIVESYLRDSEDAYSSDDENESLTSINFQDGEYIEEALDFQNHQESSVRCLQRTSLPSSPIFHRSQEDIPTATRLVDQSHGNFSGSSSNVLDMNSLSSYNADNWRSSTLARASTSETLFPLSQIIHSDTSQGQNLEDLLDRNLTDSQEDRAQSTASSRTSTGSSFTPFGLGTISSAPSIDVLHENLSLVFMTLSMRRQPRNRHSGRVLSTADTMGPGKPKTDPEKLKKLQDSLLQEDSEEEGDLCRICLMGGDNAENHLITPCQCSGSLKYVHQECMKRWLLAKITSGADLDAVKTCEMCKQNVHTEIDGFNLNEHYRRHQETIQEQSALEPSLYLLLLLHLYQQRYEELLRLNRTRDQVTEIARRISHFSLENNENNDQDST
ncbi:probable E3 ubiquitin- ligase MARCH10 [Pelobates cultripes]|nr:probable E3 ubiquitin- ligase MARCH10 [Pelobates cultripes]